MTLNRSETLLLSGALLLCGAFWGARANAQVTFYNGGSTCEMSSSCAVGGFCGLRRICIGNGDGWTGCVPEDALVCCAEAGDCPSPFDGVCVPDLLASSGLCIDPRRYCGSSSMLPTREMFQNCSRGLGGLYVGYDDGDCDQDGVSNGVEDMNGTDRCVAPPLMGIWTGTACSQLSADCAVGETCTDPTAGQCYDGITDGNGYLCVPNGDPLYCTATNEWVCPTDTEEVTGAAGDPKWCVPRICEARYGLDPLDCVISPSGEMVPWAEGDCDGDGIVNMDEGDGQYCIPSSDGGVPGEDAGTSDDAGPPGDDAGPPGDDAGPTEDASTPTEDAGNGAAIDASPRMDATTGGTPVDPTFGGGCACRASPARGDSWPLLLGLAFGLGFALTRRRR